MPLYDRRHKNFEWVLPATTRQWDKSPMSQSSQWMLFIARPGNNRQHIIRTPCEEPRIISAEDDGSELNDHLARYIGDSLNTGRTPRDTNLGEDGLIDTPSEDGGQRVSTLVSDPNVENGLEIINPGRSREDLALGHVVVDRGDNSLGEHTLSGRQASSHASDLKGSQPKSGR